MKVIIRLIPIVFKQQRTHNSYSNNYTNIQWRFRSLFHELCIIVISAWLYRKIVQKNSIFLMYYHWIEHILLYTTYTKEFWNMRRGKVSWRNLLPIRCTCNLSNKICSNHRIIILYNDQHLIILYNHFFFIFLPCPFGS